MLGIVIGFFIENRVEFSVSFGKTDQGREFALIRLNNPSEQILRQVGGIVKLPDAYFIWTHVLTVYDI